MDKLEQESLIWYGKNVHQFPKEDSNKITSEIKEYELMRNSFMLGVRFANTNIFENTVASIDLLQTRMERGEYLVYQEGEWFLFEKSGSGVTNGKTLRELLINLIWIDC